MGKPVILIIRDGWGINPHGKEGAKADGNAFIQEAIKRGAVAIASEEKAVGKVPAGVTWIQVREARKALAIAAANFLGHPGSGEFMRRATYSQP